MLWIVFSKTATVNLSLLENDKWVSTEWEFKAGEKLLVSILSCQNRRLEILIDVGVVGLVDQDAVRQVVTAPDPDFDMATGDWIFEDRQGNLHIYRDDEDESGTPRYKEIIHPDELEQKHPNKKRPSSKHIEDIDNIFDIEDLEDD